MANINLDAPELYLNRELSWLEFNDRVLQEGRSPSVPLLERLKFLAIVASNLDEFFMIRVGGLKQQEEAGRTVRDVSGLTPSEQLEQIRRRVARMTAEHSAAIQEVLTGLAHHGIYLHRIADLSPDQVHTVRALFNAEILPLLTPLAVSELDPFPLLPGLNLNLALVLGPKSGAEETEPKLAIVPIPPNLPRFTAIPAEDGLHLVRLEDVIGANIAALFHGYEIRSTAVFRLTRDADVALDDDDVSDLLEEMEQVVSTRRRRGVVRLEVSAGADPLIVRSLIALTGAAEADIYAVHGLLDASALMEIAARPGFDQLKDPQWPPQRPRDLVGSDDFWEIIQDRDVLLFHPYDSFEPVVRMVQLAAVDPNVLAIKQTLYRTSANSPIIAALAQAAKNGKQVTVLVELKARFDEARNVGWARRLEDAGCHVIYGIAGLKTHGKILMVIRREPHGIRRYVHLSTGNYNERTAALYSDVGLLTSHRDFAADASAFFNLLTGYSQVIGWSKFAVSPLGLRQRVLDLIEREIQASTPDQPGLIIAKLNSLEDKAVCQALYRASQAGVSVQLNIRGICCLRPGVPGVSDNIRVVSIIDRYLEHSRIFFFRNGGHEEVYLSSADWMQRNLDRRLEILFPIVDPALSRRLVGALHTFFRDNVKARALQPDGTYVPVSADGQAVRAQEELHRDAVEAIRAQEQATVEFRPLTQPQGPKEA